jgi:hypothetical protein
MYPRYLRGLHARPGAGGHGYELKQTLEHEFGQLLPALNAGRSTRHSRAWSVIAGVTSLPARLATRIPSAEALRYE